jgi:hypothetical protein
MASILFALGALFRASYFASCVLKQLKVQREQQKQQQEEQERQQQQQQQQADQAASSVQESKNDDKGHKEDNNTTANTTTTTAVVSDKYRVASSSSSTEEPPVLHSARSTNKAQGLTFSVLVKPKSSTERSNTTHTATTATTATATAGTEEKDHLLAVPTPRDKTREHSKSNNISQNSQNSQNSSPDGGSGGSSAPTDPRLLIRGERAWASSFCDVFSSRFMHSFLILGSIIFLKLLTTALSTVYCKNVEGPSLHLSLLSFSVHLVLGHLPRSSFLSLSFFFFLSLFQ